MDRGAWQATVHGITESDLTEVTQHACACHITGTATVFVNREVYSIGHPVSLGLPLTEKVRNPYTMGISFNFTVAIELFLSP